MLGKLSVALLLVASPALANEPAEPDAANTGAPAQEYKIKKVCHTVEVAGSFIPRRTCVNKKIPITKPSAGTEDAAKVEGGGADNLAQEQ